MLFGRSERPGTSDQSNSTSHVSIDKRWQPGTEWRQQMAEWRQQMAEGRQQQLVLQQRIEAFQQHQHYLVWRKQERERRRQVLFTEAST